MSFLFIFIGLNTFNTAAPQSTKLFFNVLPNTWHFYPLRAANPWGYLDLALCL
jgi:hypothetical protein